MKLEQLIITLEAHSDTEQAERAKSYLKDHFEHYGISAPQRRMLSKEFIFKHRNTEYISIKNIVDTCWAHEYRDLQYVAMDLLAKHLKKIEKGDVKFIKHLVASKSWWDTVDWLAAHMLGHYLLKYPEEKMHIMEEWMESGNIWLQRSCIIHQLFYRESTDRDLLASLIISSCDIKDFFIRKASGWALRQYSKTDSVWVSEFIDVNSMILSTLTKKEGLKWIRKHC